MQIDISRYPITQVVTFKNKKYMVKYLYDFKLAKLIEIVYMIDEDGRRMDDCMMAAQVEEIVLKINGGG